MEPLHAHVHADTHAHSHAHSHTARCRSCWTEVTAQAGARSMYNGRRVHGNSSSGDHSPFVSSWSPGDRTMPKKGSRPSRWYNCPCHLASKWTKETSTQLNHLTVQDESISVFRRGQGEIHPNNPFYRASERTCPPVQEMLETQV